MDSSNLYENNQVPILYCTEGFRNSIEFAQAIDNAAEGGATEKYVRELPKLKKVSNIAGGEDYNKVSISMISALMENASTIEEQLELSVGLPCILNKETQRYYLAPNAQAVLDFTRENANRPPPMINISAATLFAQRIKVTNQEAIIDK
jgi:hypothetical protein